MVTLSGESCLKFYYHMYGSSMGTLKVQLSNQVIFNESGDKGNMWHLKQIVLKGKGTRRVGARFCHFNEVVMAHMIPYWLFKLFLIISFFLIVFCTQILGCLHVYMTWLKERKWVLYICFKDRCLGMSSSFKDGASFVLSSFP